jgi:hypothetical protein
MRRLAILLGVLFVAGGSDLSAQWLNYPDPRIPRTADGKPKLDAPAPRTPDGTPDLSGSWTLGTHPAYVLNIAADLDASAISPQADRLFNQRMGDFGKDDPSTIGCLPYGARAIVGRGRAKVIQSPTLMVILFEDLSYRQIHLDGRALPADPSPSFMGYSVGHWDGDTLVVESNGFNDRTWLDFGGHPHSEKLKVVERLRRVSLGNVEREITLVDEEFYRQPIQIRGSMVLTPDSDLLEEVCTESANAKPHLVGRTPKERAVSVPASVLQGYVGTYDLVEVPEGSSGFGIRSVTLSVAKGQLLIDLNGKGKIPMVPLSQTMFSPRLLGTYEFVMAAGGHATHILAHAAEGTYRFNRQVEQ